MNILLKIIGYISLVATALAPILFFFDALGEAALRHSLLLGMIGWFVTAFLRDRQDQTSSG